MDSISFLSDNKKKFTINNEVITVNLSEVQRFLGGYSLVEIVQMGFDIEECLECMNEDLHLGGVDFYVACQALSIYRIYMAGRRGR